MSSSSARIASEVAVRARREAVPPSARDRSREVGSAWTSASSGARCWRPARWSASAYWRDAAGGHARIGVWGCGLPAPGEAVYNVRQNLPPLVLKGRPTAAAAEWTLWGATLGGGAYVARSAISQDAAGDLIYAASMSAVPADLASVLASHGARVAWSARDP